tara:strand:- start:721 stop:1320 length:600 start_codon:yes stop_codon:yes gene_type:complete
MYINLNSSAVFLLSTEIIIHIADTYNNRLGVMMSEYAKHKIQHEILIGGGSNAFFNGIIAWLTLREGPSLTWLGSSSFVVDITATAFILPFIVALIVIPLQKKKLQKGAAETINFGPKSLLQHWVNRLPDATFLNAIIFGVIGVLIAAPTPLIIFYILDIEQIEPMTYAIFKGCWAGIMAGILVIPMVMSALRERYSLT